MSDRLSEGERRALILGIGAAGVVLASFLLWFFVLRDRWEEKNLARLRDLNQQAADWVARGDAKDADGAYEQVVQEITARPRISASAEDTLSQAEAGRVRTQQLLFRSQTLPELQRLSEAARAALAAGDFARASRACDQVLAKIGPEIADYPESKRIEAEAKTLRQTATARAVEQARAEQARRRAEKEAAAVAESRRRADAERERLANADQAAAAKRAQQAGARAALRAATFKGGTAYAEAKRRAGEILVELNNKMILEDSAYRAISRRSRAARDMLGLWVKVEGELNGVDVTREVDRVIVDADAELVLEESAVRAAYKSDRAFFELVGIWCKALGDGHADALAAFRTKRAEVSTAVALDDSAPRAIMAYTEASVAILQKVLAAKGLGARADDIASEGYRANLLEDSAWRACRRNSESIANMLLVILERRNAPRAMEIRNRVRSTIRTETSALRSHSECKQGTVEALYYLIMNP